MFYVQVAAGNFRDANACDVSPARVPSALTVGASGSDDRAYVHGASGPCVDAWVPGVDIRSACGGARRCAYFYFHMGKLFDVVFYLQVREPVG